MMTQVETFNQYRPLLFSIAYRMLGSVMDAEDMVQEAFLRWHRASESEVTSTKAYLSTVVTRLCLDYLKSARVQREVYVGPWLPEPLLTKQTPDLIEKAELADSLSIAFLAVLETLSPVERAVFLLHEIFDYSYSEIALMVEKSEANCRQMVKRARQHLQERRPRYDVSLEQQERMLQQFMKTCNSGDMTGFITLLTDDITLRSDGGGKVSAARNPLHGPDKVARFFLGILAKAPPSFKSRVAEVNGQPAIISYLDGKLYNVVTLDFTPDHIRAINIISNPDKLRGIKDEG